MFHVLSGHHQVEISRKMTEQSGDFEITTKRELTERAEVMSPGIGLLAFAVVDHLELVEVVDQRLGLSGRLVEIQVPL